MEDGSVYKFYQPREGKSIGSEFGFRRGEETTLLAEAGARLTDVAKATVYVTDRAFLADVGAAVLQRLAGAAPAFTSVIVKGLASPELLMEVDIVAIRGGTP